MVRIKRPRYSGIFQTRKDNNLITYSMLIREEKSDITSINLGLILKPVILKLQCCRLWNG